MIARRQAWFAYLLMVCQGFLFYGVGFLTPYLASELGAPAWASALPNSAMAVGLLVASSVVPRVVHALGPFTAVRLWATLMVAAAMVTALADSIPGILVGALGIGIGSAGALTFAVTTFAGQRNGVLLVRATLASVVGGVVGPLVLSAAARSIGWNLGILAVVPLALVLAAVGPARGTMGAATVSSPALRDRPREPSLGRAYWLAWTFLVLCIGAESSFVAWGAQVAVVQAGIPLAEATALGALFVLGEILGRIGLGAGRGVAAEPRRMLAVMTVAGIAGGLLVWAGGTAGVAGAGLLVGGLAIAGIWPTTAGLALGNAPRSPVKAGARLNLASGAAVLVVPVLLGVVATLGGVLTAWAIVVGLLAAALVVLRIVPARA